MASVEDFESTLKDLVSAKRVSARKMNDLTGIAMKSMKEDTQLVSILYRTHKNLSPAAKISSLYAVDALSRAARSQASKHPHSNDPKSSEGNCATFLLKVEGVLDGLFTGMVTLNHPEAKEKTQKILDIWIKGNTFPSALLSRLKDILIKADEGRKETENNEQSGVPSMNAIPTLPPEAASSAVPDPQATLLALLAQAANAATSANGGQIHPNTGTAARPPSEQLAFIHQLAQAAKDGTLGQSTPAQGPPPSVPLTHQGGPPGGPAPRSPQSHREDHNFHRRPARYDNYDESDRGHDFNDYHRNNHAGTSRGYRGFRGRGRGHEPRGGRWEDRGDRIRERERSPPRRARRSRSRSPPSRYGGRRDIRPYSPPRRPSDATSGGNMSTGTQSSRHNPNEPEKDEFGRDIRPQSPVRSDTPAAAAATPTAHTHQPPENLSSNPSVEAATSHDRNDQPTPSSIATEPPSETTTLTDNTAQPQMNAMEQFDYTNPASWEALGKQWQSSYGYAPSMNELMQYVMTGGMMANQMDASMSGWANGSWDSASSSMYGNGTWHGGRGRGGINRGRGGYGRGNPRDTQGPMDEDGMGTDAIVLGENTTAPATEELPQQQRQPQGEYSIAGSNGGKMQRVGDKWIFVRDTGAAA